MDIWSIFRRAADLYADRTAVVAGERRLRYRELAVRVGSLVSFLRRAGLDPGDRVSILDHNSLPYLEFYFAAAGAGVVLNPLNVRLSPAELAFILADAGSRWLVASSEFAPLVRAIVEAGGRPEGIIAIGPTEGFGDDIPVRSYDEIIGAATSSEPTVPVSGGDLAHLYYTSGTTGRAKGVMLTHGNVTAHAFGAAVEFRLSEDDIWGHIAPMFHLADAWATFAITLVGGCHVMVPRFDPRSVLATVEREKITLTNLIPTMLNLMVKHPDAERFDYRSLRLILSGGAPIAPRVVDEIVRVFGCEYVQTYGMTETSPYLTVSILKEHLRSLPPKEQLAYRARTGRPFITVDLKVVDGDGLPVRPDDAEVGEIWVRGDTVTPGYWNRPEETRAAFHDGWLRTGDLAVVDAEGYVNIVDRRKDMIISGGENVYSTEVENVLYAHPAVLEAAVFGIPDEVYGEAVTAAVVVRPGAQATAAGIISFCKEKIAAFKAPKSVKFVDELPRTGSGKIYKQALRDRYADQTQNSYAHDTSDTAS
jgi:acyl-CoA synthetase (AMP-forming)/AMP-acid ligase II